MLHEWLAMPRSASYTKAEAYGPTTSSFRFSPERVACFAGPSVRACVPVCLCIVVRIGRGAVSLERWHVKSSVLCALVCVYRRI